MPEDTFSRDVAHLIFAIRYSQHIFLHSKTIKTKNNRNDDLKNVYESEGFLIVRSNKTQICVLSVYYEYYNLCECMSSLSTCQVFSDVEPSKQHRKGKKKKKRSRNPIESLGSIVIFISNVCIIFMKIE